MQGPALPANYQRHCAARNGEMIALTGGASHPSSFLMFDWESQSWTHMPSIPTSRYDHGCEIVETANGNELWLLGGVFSDSVEIFNFDSFRWSIGTPLPGPRAGLSTVVINNIIFMGGSDEDHAHSNIWEWNPNSNSWDEREIGLDGPRSFFGAALVDERSGVVCI